MQPVVIDQRVGSKVVKRLESTGGVLHPLLKLGVTRPIWMFGHGSVQTPVFTCPVSAVPAAVWDLLDLWFTCRAMRALPKAGGVLDQPLSVRKSFPVFEAEHEVVLRRRRANDSVTTMAAVLGRSQQ